MLVCDLAFIWSTTFGLTVLLGENVVTVKSLAGKSEGDRVQFRGRIHHSRPLGPKIIFLIFRQQTATIQGILTVEEGRVSESMVRWAEHLRRESIVLVEGIIQRPKDGQDEVKTASIHDLEVKIDKMYVVAEPTVNLPFQVVDVSKPTEFFENNEGDAVPRVGDRTRLDNRVLDLRAPASQAIFRIHSAITKLFRSYLDEQGFIEINSSKLQGTATESGASVFKVDYFRRPAYLAQSPQLAKQMCIAADMERVYEIGPVFRAENSNTHRHLTEFTGLDLEMAITYNYGEVLDMIDGLLLHIFRNIQKDYAEEIEIIKQQFPHDDLVFPEKTLRLKFSDGIKLLIESGWKEENGSEPTEFEDLSTKAEQRLGQLVKEKYNTDYYILDKFPLAARPFYTMPDAEDERFSNSFDIFVRGEEILSGGQRIHKAPDLEEKMRAAGIVPDMMKEYVDGFRWGCPPHGGGGLGLERLLMLFLSLHNVRWASLFARDPKSFANANSDPVAASEAAQVRIINGPKARTIKKRGEEHEMPALEDIIAKYGDATNTSLTDPAWTVWRHHDTGAAVGYIAEGGYAVIFGNPLCESSQIPRVVRSFLRHIKRERKLRPVWCCIDKETEKFLANELGWSAIIAVAEERLDPTRVDLGEDKNFRRKIHRAEKEGVKVHEVDGEPDQELQEKVNKRLVDWQEARKGKQVHISGLRPFDDMAHRRYFYTTDKNGEVCCLVVLAQLAAIHGFQIKWALEFPDAPPGAIEYILAHVIQKMGEAGIRQATFGAGATLELRRADNVGGFRFMMLEKAYAGVAKAFPLSGKGDFRQKFGVYQDPLYIAYPKGSLGLRGINAIMEVMQKPK
ncbi:hypothetical protein M422DRAFT_158559 [Sphaerobolus stellatus SS14]|nr:hypothetical protein M422DRAFT_158559 [Sphaerobolus stellatus SS14]